MSHLNYNNRHDWCRGINDQGNFRGEISGGRGEADEANEAQGVDCNSSTGDMIATIKREGVGHSH